MDFRQPAIRAQIAPVVRSALHEHVARISVESAVSIGGDASTEQNHPFQPADSVTRCSTFNTG